jgi:hypothetical protein
MAAIPARTASGRRCQTAASSATSGAIASASMRLAERSAWEAVAPGTSPPKRAGGQNASPLLRPRSHRDVSRCYHKGLRKPLQIPPHPFGSSRRVAGVHFYRQFRGCRVGLASQYEPLRLLTASPWIERRPWGSRGRRHCHLPPASALESARPSATGAASTASLSIRAGSWSVPGKTPGRAPGDARPGKHGGEDIKAPRGAASSASCAAAFPLEQAERP